MVYVAMTSEGFREIVEAPETAKFAIWCGADAVSEAQFQKLEDGNVTRLNYSVSMQRYCTGFAGTTGSSGIAH